MSCITLGNTDQRDAMRNKEKCFRSPKDEDTEALAEFLLALKHRSVTPEPTLNDSSFSSLSSHQITQSSDFRNSSPFQYETSDEDTCSPNPSPPHVASQLMDGRKPDLQDRLMDFDALIADSKLVCIEDRDLVPDPLFAAMAQMKRCRLQHADRVGCYKNRELGFIGMSCKWCGGQPGFGRYYPNSVRSLAQTTTSQTILKHITSKCRFCPPEVRNTILELQQLQAAREGLPTGRPRYGSRKIFFQRVWQRLHDGDLTKDVEEVDEKTSVSIDSSEEGSIGPNSGDESGNETASSGEKRRKNNLMSRMDDSRDCKRSKLEERTGSSPFTAVL